MNRYIILIIAVLVVAAGCKSTSGKRLNKDITGINEQLYDLEKNQIKDANRLETVESQVKQLMENKKPLSKPEDKETEDADKIYKEGYKYYLEQNYAEAIKALSRLTGRFKDDTLIDNALYWQAESYSKMNQNDQALKYYQMIYRYFPFSNKADSALYKIGLIYVDLNDYERALLAFNRLIDEYPGSDLFKTVSLKIKEIKDKNKIRSKQ
jgi:TolA-binding protein